MTALRQLHDNLEVTLLTGLARENFRGALTREKICEGCIKTFEAAEAAVVSAVARHVRDSVREAGKALEESLWEPEPSNAGPQSQQIIETLVDVEKWQQDLDESVLPTLAAVFATGAVSELEMLEGLKGLQEKTTAQELAAELEIDLTGLPLGELPEWIVQAAREAAAEVFSQEYWTKIPLTTLEDIRKTIEASIIEGLSIREVAQSIIGMVDDTGATYDRIRALRIARTECLAGDVRVDSAAITAAHRRPYRGDLIEIVTDGGNKFTGTPNHPMLTVDGWKSLGDLTENDRLIGHNPSTEQAGTSGDVNVEARPAQISQIFDSLTAVSARERASTGKPDFHGDGMDAYVDILRPGGLLPHGTFPAIAERSIQPLLAPAHVRAVLLATQRDFRGERIGRHRGSLGNRANLVAVAAYQSNYIRRSYAILLAQLLRRATAGVPFADFPFGQILTKRPVAGFQHASSGIGQRANHARPEQSPANRIGTDTELQGDFTVAEPGQIQLHRIVSKRTRQNVSCHVFNLTTKDGYFLAEGLYTGNTGHMLNAGHMESIRQVEEETGLAIGKTWISVFGSTTRDSHAAVSGTTVGREENFTLGGVQVPHPSHWRLPAGDRCNCQCTIISSLLTEGLLE